MQEQVPRTYRTHLSDDVERLVPTDALASGLLGMLMASLAVIFGHRGDLAGMLLAGAFLFGGLGLVHWLRRVRSGP